MPDYKCTLLRYKREELVTHPPRETTSLTLTRYDTRTPRTSLLHPSLTLQRAINTQTSQRANKSVANVIHIIDIDIHSLVKDRGALHCARGQVGIFVFELAI